MSARSKSDASPESFPSPDLSKGTHRPLASISVVITLFGIPYFFLCEVSVPSLDGNMQSAQLAIPPR